MFYRKLAKSNLKTNKRAYLPFLVSMTFLVVINTIMQILLKNKGMDALPSAYAAKQLFGFGSYVILIFTAIFSLYTNSFLIKQRKKELGLYNILGMGKKELTRMLFWETLYSYLITLLVGIVFGTGFAKIFFLAFKKLSNMGADFTYQFSFSSLLYVAVVFLIIYGLLFVWNTLQLKLANPIDLLRGDQHGEKEPKTKWLLSIIGILCLGGGYYISLTIKSPIQATILFFVAVVLVIIGTYALFTASSITILKLLRKNKKFYYQPNHFISVSSMIYRMKQNAAGLASICILSTMVLVTVSTTSSLFFGIEDVLRNRNPADMSFSAQSDITAIEPELIELANQHQVTFAESERFQTSATVGFLKKDNHFDFIEPTSFSMDDVANMSLVKFITLDEYNRLSNNSSEKLAANQILVYSTTKSKIGQTLAIGPNDFQVKERLKSIDFISEPVDLVDSYFIVMDTVTTIENTINSVYPKEDYPDQFQMINYLMLTLAGTEEDRFAFALDVQDTFYNSAEEGTPLGTLKSTGDVSFDSIDIDREDSLSFIGGFMFLGIIFGITFTLATAIIIYYKQISEGTQDQARYDIMQRVGMSHMEVQKTIRSQILMVFFFPIALATLHLAFAFPIIKKLLLLFGLANGDFFMKVSIITVLCFFAIYLLMFWQTSKVYYKIVERKPGKYIQ